jgi:hypothetical protein
MSVATFWYVDYNPDTEEWRMTVGRMSGSYSNPGLTEGFADEVDIFTDYAGRPKGTKILTSLGAVLNEMDDNKYPDLIVEYSPVFSPAAGVKLRELEDRERSRRERANAEYDSHFCTICGNYGPWPYHIDCDCI